MTILRIFLFIAVFLFLFIPVSAFEDTFQYYPGGDYSENWMVITDPWPGQTTKDIYDYTDASHSRIFRIRAWDTPQAPDIELTTTTPDQSNYWAMTLKRLDIGYHSACQCGAGAGYTADFYVRFYDDDGYLLFTYAILPQNCSRQTGRYEFNRDSDTNQITLKINGVSQGVVGSASSQMAYVGFRYYTTCSNSDEYTYYYFDDVTTTGDIVGVCSESITHKITELINDDINISFAINTIPLASFESGEYKVVIKRSVSGSFVDVDFKVVKETSDVIPVYGFADFSRFTLTGGDADYGLYVVYLTQDDVSLDTDYFFFAPPGDASSISFSNPEIPIGTTETISYTIDAADFGTYSYHVRVYSTTEQIQSTTITETSSTVSWDTTDENTGLYYAVLSRTDKSSGAYSELTYDIAILSNDIVIRGHIYDAQNETVLDNVSVNFSQASTWYNTTSNATGYYELSGLIATVEINVNASLVNYTHENFTFTPLTAEIYTVDLYLINNTPTYDNTTIGGLTYDYPLHQAVINSTVNIYNATWSNTTTSSLITGFYLFEELTNGSYDVNATKTGYQDSDEYSVDTNNGSWENQNILMYGIYDLTIKAQDSTTLAYLSTFSILFEGDVYTTTNGTVVLIDLTYDLYSVSVSAENYYASAEDILVDETKTEVVSMTQTSSEYYVEHFVEFVVRNVWNTVYPDVDVTVYEGSSTTDYKSGTTGSNGAVTFQLSEDIEYRLTFISTDLGIDEEITLYPVEFRYYVYVDAYSFNPPNTTTDDITATITSSRINSTHGYINFSWSDPGALTSSIEYSISDVDGNELYNTSNSGPDMTDSQIVAAVDVRYIVQYTGIHPTHGTINHVQTVVFYGGRMVDLGWTEDWQYAVTSFSFIIFIGALFGARTAHYGAIAVVMLAWFFMWIGWLNATNTSLTLIILATIVAFGYAMRKGEEVKQ